QVRSVDESGQHVRAWVRTRMPRGVALLSQTCRGTGMRDEALAKSGALTRAGWNCDVGGRVRVQRTRPMHWQIPAPRWGADRVVYGFPTAEAVGLYVDLFVFWTAGGRSCHGPIWRSHL